ncbi:hypothetical protein TELCIR_10093 [Teladorsagia circumcincta]|uniref:Uncharacterized protein n=1 Tax=Teladorsagia circumcincta TaxID=45464 RepID=A0A2G9UD90_TELCI|nr:hypothetical protein TELCIR_10093 [Teladorsagia circumcincta]
MEKTTVLISSWFFDDLMEKKKKKRRAEEDDDDMENGVEGGSGEGSDVDDEGTNANGAAADDVDPLDSDDEEPGASGFRPKAEQYLEKVVTDTVDDYLLDEDEIDRRLLGLGIGGEVEQLMGVLSEEERAAFAQLAEQINIDTSGLDESCFKKR